MRSGTASGSLESEIVITRLQVSFGDLLSSTMVGGTALLGPSMVPWVAASGYGGNYVAVRIEEILEYERKIIELQWELLHYKRLLSGLMTTTERAEEHSQAVLPLNAASVRLIDSVLEARIPSSATFTDFQEGEL